jgi:Zn-dependent peptidase ImmA (M78 family)
MPPVRVEVSQPLFQWARERARLSHEALAGDFPKLAAWERGEARPTLRQLESYARRTHTAIGFFFLPEPPDEPLPIPDFRTTGNANVERPSGDLLDTIYLCQQRQDWYREYAALEAAEPHTFVGSIVPASDVISAARQVRGALGLDLAARAALKTWEEALRVMVNNAEDLGVMVMRNGVVGNNTHRKLDRDEFRGFALSDDLAPLVFINAADSKSGQMFTLAHELIHIFTASSGVSDSSPRRVSHQAFERWCNQVAAEVLVPLANFAQEYDRTADRASELSRLARQFKVSTLVVLRRMYDARGLTRDEFWTAYDAELERIRAIAPKGSGGDFHATEAVRVSRRFATALIGSTLEGLTLYRDAFRLLGISKTETFREFSASLGLAV